MQEKKCKLCEHLIEPGRIERHQIVPTHVTEQAGLPETKTLRVCSNCYREMQEWYLNKVSDTAYNLKTKRFTDKSCLEMVREYQATFDGFVKYKKKQMNSAKR